MGIRVLCCAVVFCCAALTGLELRRRLFVRLRSLQYFREYFRFVRSNISHYGMSLEDIANEHKPGEQLPGFTAILRENTQQQPFASAFADALRVMQTSLGLTEEDRAALCAVVNRIGGADTDGALEVLQAADEQLSERIAGAKEQCETEGKVRVVLALSGGAFAALLLL